MYIFLWITNFSPIRSLWQTIIFYHFFFLCWYTNYKFNICLPHSSTLGPVVRRLISTNLGLNLNLGFLFFCSRAFSPVIFSVLYRASNHGIHWRQKELDWVYLLSHFQILILIFLLILGYLIPALNNPALLDKFNPFGLSLYFSL